MRMLHWPFDGGHGSNGDLILILLLVLLLAQQKREFFMNSMSSREEDICCHKVSHAPLHWYPTITESFWQHDGTK